MFDGKMKAVTFSYDDGVTQDKRLIDIFNRYGLKATFNLNSAFFGLGGDIRKGERTATHIKVRRDEVSALYAGHEIASHTLTHPNLTGCSDEEIIRQVEEDRLALSELAGYEVVGFAYPGGAFDDRVAEVLRTRTGVRYARTVCSTHSFERQTDSLYTFHPTVYHAGEMDTMFELGEKFLAMKPDTPQLFYIWGHAYEFDLYEGWERFEEFCKLIAGHDDIFYGTNREVLLG